MLMVPVVVFVAGSFCGCSFEGIVVVAVLLSVASVLAVRGNRRFRSIVSTYIDDYESCKSKIDKSLILGQIVDRVREQDNGRARFLKYDSKLKCWCVLTNDQAREKVGHAIRECVQSTKDKQINEAKQLQLQKQEEYHQLHILTQMLFSS